MGMALSLQCEMCSFKFKIGQFSSVPDIAYCPHCGDNFLEYYPKQEGVQYQHREKNFFYHHKKTGNVWNVLIQEDESKKEFFVDVQGPETDREAFEAVKEFLKAKKMYLPCTVVDIRCIGIGIDKKL